MRINSLEISYPITHKIIFCDTKYYFMTIIRRFSYCSCIKKKLKKIIALKSL